MTPRACCRSLSAIRAGSWTSWQREAALADAGQASPACERHVGTAVAVRAGESSIAPGRPGCRAPRRP